MSTYRDRRMNKAARLEEWADKRDDKATVADAKSRAISDHIPFGQPILVGHHSEGRHRRDLARIHANTDKAIEHTQKAGEFRSRAESIRRQAEHAIYSDDHDAIERLEEKIAGLVTERDRWKAFNACCRKHKRITDEALALLDESQRKNYLNIVRVAAFQIRANGSAPSYVVSNLGGNINRLQKRLEQLRQQSQ